MYIQLMLSAKRMKFIRGKTTLPAYGRAVARPCMQRRFGGRGYAADGGRATARPYKQKNGRPAPPLEPARRLSYFLIV